MYALGRTRIIYRYYKRGAYDVRNYIDKCPTKEP